MRSTLLLAAVFCLISTVQGFGQQARAVPVPNYSVAPAAAGLPSDAMAVDIARISQSVEAMNRNIAKFTSTFSSNQGLKLTERQQKLLFALEALNRTEANLMSAQKQRLDHAERQSRMRLQLSGINENLLPQSLDRYASLRGTVNAVELREARRLTLEKERQELSNTVERIQTDLDRLNEDIRRSELQVAAIRARLFGEVEKELADL